MLLLSNPEVVKEPIWPLFSLYKNLFASSVGSVIRLTEFFESNYACEKSLSQRKTVNL